MECEFEFLEDEYEYLVQDTGTFSATIEYMYASDSMTSVTLIG